MNETGGVESPKEFDTPRQVLLKEAMKITAIDRNRAYGNPEDNFRNIADYWSNYLSANTGTKINLAPADIAHMMVLMKVARLSTNIYHRDSVVDIAGYAACAADCIAAEQNKNRSVIAGVNSAELQRK